MRRTPTTTGRGTKQEGTVTLPADPAPIAPAHNSVVTAPLVGTVQAPASTPEIMTDTPLGGLFVGTPLRIYRCIQGHGVYTPPNDGPQFLILREGREREDFSELVQQWLFGVLTPVSAEKVATIGEGMKVRPVRVARGLDWAGFSSVILTTFRNESEPLGVPAYHADWGLTIFLSVHEDRRDEELRALLTPENISQWLRHSMLIRDGQVTPTVIHQLTPKETFREWRQSLPWGDDCRVSASHHDTFGGLAIRCHSNDTLCLFVAEGREDEEIAALLAQIEQNGGEPIETEMHPTSNPDAPGAKGRYFRLPDKDHRFSVVAVLDNYLDTDTENTEEATSCSRQK